MVFQCNNPNCLKTFPFTAKTTTTLTPILQYANESLSTSINLTTQNQTLTVTEKYVCPYCGAPLEYNIAYGTEDCPACGEVVGNCE